MGIITDVGDDNQIPDKSWKRIEPLIPLPKPKKKPGRPRKGSKKIMSAIFYVLRTGCQWKSGKFKYREIWERYGMSENAFYDHQAILRGGKFKG